MRQLSLSRLPPQVFALGTFLFVAATGACVKALGRDMPFPLSMSFRFCIGFLILLPMIMRAGGFKKTLRTAQPGKQMLRAVFSTANLALQFWALPRMGLADGTALYQTLGFFLLLFSVPILQEKIHPRYFLTCALGFIGVLLIVHPHGHTPLIPSLAMLGSAALSAVTILTVRLVSRHDAELTILTWLFSVASLISLAWLIGFAHIPTLTMKDIALLLGAGLSGSCSQLCMTRAFKQLGADALGPYTYSGVVFSALLGLCFFHEAPTVWTLAGAAIILFGIHANHRLARRLRRLEIQ